MKPLKGSFPGYFETYIQYVKQDNLNEALLQSWTEVISTLSGIPESQSDYAYAPGKWTIKQLVNHLIDTERIFAYRALRFARKDPQQVLPFEENNYAEAADVSNRSLKDLLDEFEAVRKSNILLFKSFSEATLLRSGKTAAGDVTVLALGYCICGHSLHHLKVLKERYLKAL